MVTYVADDDLGVALGEALYNSLVCIIGFVVLLVSLIGRLKSKLTDFLTGPPCVASAGGKW